MLSGNDLAKKLATTGTGKDKLNLCRQYTQANEAIQALRKRNHFATVRKAEALVADDAKSAKPKTKPKPEPVEKPAIDTAATKRAEPYKPRN